MSKPDYKQTNGRVVSVDSVSTRGRLQLIVAFAYEVEEELYEDKFYTFDSIHIGDSLIVTYDVLDPKRNDLGTRQTHINRIAVAVAVPLVSAVLLLLWFSLRR